MLIWMHYRWSFDSTVHAALKQRAYEHDQVQQNGQAGSRYSGHNVDDGRKPMSSSLSRSLALSLSLSLAISLSLSLSLSLPPLLLLDFCSLYLYVYNGVPSSALSLSRALSLSLSVAPSLSQIGYYFRPWFLYSKCICLIYHIRLAHTLSEAIYAIISVAIFFFFISYIFSGVRSLIIFLRLVCFLFFLLFYFNTFLKLTSVLTNMPSN